MSASFNPQDYKKMGEKTLATHIRKKSKKDKKRTITAISNGIRSKIQPIPVTPDGLERFEAKDAETEDLAESVDNGCLPDSSSDIMADLIDTAQVSDPMEDYIYVIFFFFFYGNQILTDLYLSLICYLYMH